MAMNAAYAPATVAGAAVEMGPRNRRRAIHACVALAVVVAFGAGVLLSQRPNHSGPVAVRGSTGLRGVGAYTHIVFGMPAAKVQRMTGRPAAIEGDCWLFRPSTNQIGSVALGFTRPNTRDAVKFCFEGGVFSSASQHILALGKWEWIAWPMMIMRVPH